VWHIHQQSDHRHRHRQPICQAIVARYRDCDDCGWEATRHKHNTHTWNTRHATGSEARGCGTRNTNIACVMLSKQAYRENIVHIHGMLLWSSLLRSSFLGRAYPSCWLFHTAAFVLPLQRLMLCHSSSPTPARAQRSHFIGALFACYHGRIRQDKNVFQVLPVLSCLV
jgi:hypothetical protein